MNKLYEELKIDIGLKNQAINATAATGSYFSMLNYRKAVAVLLTAVLADTETAKLEIFEADDASGTNAVLVSGAAATITASGAMAEGKAFVEIDGESLSKPFIACKVTVSDSTGNCLNSVVLFRGRARKSITQDADASAVL